MRRVVIFADNDDSFTGQTAAFDLAARLADRVSVEIETPITVGADWADMLTKRKRVAFNSEQLTINWRGHPHEVFGAIRAHAREDQTLNLDNATSTRTRARENLK